MGNAYLCSFSNIVRNADHVSYCSQHDGNPYCNHPCYAAEFGPKGKHFSVYVTSSYLGGGQCMAGAI